MPVPKPTEKETESEFMERCMGDETMQQDYRSQAQRVAICLTQWKRREKNDQQQ